MPAPRSIFVCPPATEVEALAADGGLTVIPVDLRPGSRRANAAALASVIARHDVQLVNSQSARDRAALTWLRLTGRLPMPLVLTRRQMPRTFVLENYLASRAADRVIAVSSAVARALRRRGTPERKLSVIPNGLVAARVDRSVSDRALFDWKDRIGWDTGHRTIGIVARPKDQHVVAGGAAQCAHARTARARRRGPRRPDRGAGPRGRAATCRRVPAVYQ